MDKSDLTASVKALRLALGDTQQAFATRLNAAIRTVARWETVRPPSGASLSKLERLAASNGLPDLERVFGSALADELGKWDTSDFNLRLDPQNDIERLFVAAILRTVREAKYSAERAQIVPLLKKQAKSLIKNLDIVRTAVPLSAAIDKLLDMGIDAGAIAQALKVPEAEVQKRVTSRNWTRILHEQFMSNEFVKEEGSQ